MCKRRNVVSSPATKGRFRAREKRPSLSLREKSGSGGPEMTSVELAPRQKQEEVRTDGTF